MTFVAALMAKDGMVFVGDGRVNSLDLEIIKDDQLKLFELTPLCIVLPAGGVSDNLPYVISIIRGGLETFNQQSINDAVLRFSDFWKKKITVENGNIPLGFTFAGYNLLPNGRYEPKIYSLTYNARTCEWDMYESRGDDSFHANGTNQKSYYQFLNEEYAKGKNSLKSRNILALRALKFAHDNNPESVGGETALWNLKPGGKLIKLTSKQVKKLETDL